MIKKCKISPLNFFILIISACFLLKGLAYGDLNEGIKIKAIVTDETQSIFKSKNLTDTLYTLKKGNELLELKQLIKTTTHHTNAKRVNFSLDHCVLRFFDSQKNEEYYTRLGRINRAGNLTNRALKFSLDFSHSSSIMYTEAGEIKLTFTIEAFQILNDLKGMGLDLIFKVEGKVSKNSVKMKFSDVESNMLTGQTNFIPGEAIKITIAKGSYQFAAPYELFTLHKNGGLAESILKSSTPLTAKMTINATHERMKLGQKTEVPISFNYPIVSLMTKFELKGLQNLTLWATEDDSDD